MLGLPYPGGPNVEKLAKTGANVIEFPKMLKNYHGSPYDFSYSGLKTSVINYVHNNLSRGEEINKGDVACSFQNSAIMVLVEKSIKALKETGYKTLTVSGGVGANGFLREQLSIACEKEGIKLVLPTQRLCTDNACMIACEGYLQYKKGNFAELDLNASAVVPI